MNDTVLPTTDERVPRATRASVNDRIQARTLHDVSRFIGADPVFIDERISQLQREWDIERTLEANAASVFLAGLGLGLFVDRRFFLLPAAAKLKFKHRQGMILKEMMLEGVLGILEGQNPRLIEGKMMSFLDEKYQKLRELAGKTKAKAA